MRRTLPKVRLFEESIYIYSYFEKGCRKNCARDNLER